MRRIRFNIQPAIPWITLLIISLSCSGLTGGTPTSSQPEETTLKSDVVYGSGPFDLPNPGAGLSDLSSYKATLSLSFDGTRDGQAEKWVKTHMMLMQKEPATRLLTIESSGDLPDLNPVFLAEAEGASYERTSDDICSVRQIEAGKSLGETLEPASFLNYVVGADEAGSETINDVPANHYTFDQNALGQGDLTESSGEMWVASEGGYIVKYVLTANGKSDYFGEGIEGVLTFDYELTEVNQPIEIELPEDCPPGLVDAPQLPDASNPVSIPGLLSYDTQSNVQDAAAFYQQEIPKLGWELFEEPGFTETSALIGFTKDDRTMSVMITAANDVTTVQIALNRPQQ